MICPNCKNPVQEKAKECEWCGVMFENSNSHLNNIDVVFINNVKNIWGKYSHAMITFKRPSNLSNHPFFSLTDGNGRWMLNKSIPLKYTINGKTNTIVGFAFGFPNKSYPNGNFVTAKFMPSNNKDRDCFPLSMQGVFEIF